MQLDNWFDIRKRLEKEEESDLPVKDCVCCVPIGDSSRIYVVKLWNGIYLWANDIEESVIPMEEKTVSYITLNYALSGRCEKPINNGETFVYVDEGIMCLDDHDIETGFYYPGGKYQGIEFGLQTSLLQERSPLSDYGISIKDMTKRLLSSNGTYMRSINEHARGLSKDLFEDLTDGDGDLYSYRFKAIECLRSWLLDEPESLTRIRYCSKGQREIARRVEMRITEDLSKHIVISEMAKEFGVSPSALKKYFEAVYGENISSYVRRNRIEKAMKMLAETRLPIGEISARAGYSHQGKFGEVFKDQTGLTPLEYRRRYFKSRKEEQDEAK